MNESEKRVKEARADAASRLPKAEKPTSGFCVCENDWTDGTSICQECGLPRIAPALYVPAAPSIAEPAPQTFEEWWDSDKQWEVARSLEGEDNCDECCGVYARAAWNAAKASYPGTFRPVRNASGMEVCKHCFKSNGEHSPKDECIDNLGNHLGTNWDPLMVPSSSPAELSPAIRMQLWLSHGCGLTPLYGDDGEMQCNRAPFIDFKRDSEATILAGIAKHNEQRRLAEASSPAVAGEESERREIRQKLIGDWAIAAFGEAEALSLPQRGLRLMEEAAEAAQSTGVTEAQASSSAMKKDWSQLGLKALNYLNDCLLDGVPPSTEKLREILDIPASSPETGEPLPNGKPNTPENALLLRWNKAAAQAGMAGSEYIDDPERVFARVHENREALMRSLVAAKKASSPVVDGGESASILTAENVCKLIDDLPKVLPEVARLMKIAVRKGECPHALRVSLRLKPLTCFVQEPFIKDVRGKE